MVSAWSDPGLLVMALVRGASLECKDRDRPDIACWRKALDLEVVFHTHDGLTGPMRNSLKLKALIEFLWGVQKAGGYHDIKAMEAFVIREQILASTTYNTVMGAVA